jgi:hypothetical protein
MTEGSRSFWGVQHHPEVDFRQLVAPIETRAERFIQEGLERSREDAARRSCASGACDARDREGLFSICGCPSRPATALGLRGRCVAYSKVRSDAAFVRSQFATRLRDHRPRCFIGCAVLSTFVVGRLRPGCCQTRFAT